MRCSIASPTTAPPTVLAAIRASVPVWTLLFMVVMVGGCTPSTAPSTAPTPNLLILSVDTLRADALGFMGSEAVQTPNLDRLAERGTIFTQAITPVPRTTPGLSSLLTGLSPKLHGSRDVGDAIAEGIPTLAETLAARGYLTLGVSTNDSAGPMQGLDRGFQQFIDYRALQESYDPDLYRDLTDAPATAPGWANATRREALQLLDSALEGESGRPWMLWTFFFDPHFLYRPPSPWQDGVEASACWELYETYAERRSEAGQVFFNVGGVAEAVVDECRQLYDAEIAYVDHEIGLLLDALEKEGRLKNTVIVFTADHGENFGEGGLYFEHGDNAHDAALRVPLVFVGPGVEAGKRDDGTVGLIDVMPTALTLLGVPGTERPPAEGIDLTPRLLPGGSPGRQDRQRILFAESASPIFNEAVGNVTTGRTWWRVCINGPRFSLCEIPQKDPVEVALYDHQTDPGLTHNVHDEHPQAVARLREAWKRWPPESARDQVARTSRFKLVRRPLLEGGYSASLYDLAQDPEELRDVSALHPKIFQHLLAAIEAWSVDLPELPQRSANPELEESLRALGYLP